MSLVSDMSVITTIPLSTLNKLVDKEQLCILHKIVESELKGDPITAIELGFGTLYIKHDDDEIKYKFIPSKQFENNVKTVITTGESPLIATVEEALKDKILSVYKDLF